MLNRLQEKRNEGGFTLIELLIVIVILAILAAIVVFAVGTTTNNAVAASCRADAKSVETAAEAYKAQTGSFPASVAALTGSQVIAGQTVGPWLRQVPSSPSYSIAMGGSGTVLADLGTVAPTDNFDANPVTSCG
jgi:prepilin-type N-terminal cleavage/methylation domain-containing protein